MSALVGLPWRLVRRGSLLLCLAGALYALVEVVSYEQTYPDQQSRQQLASLADSPAVRALQGVPRAVDTTGGFVVWDAGWFLALVVAVWALLATTRLLREEEDTGRAELVLARPVAPARLLLVQVGVLLAVVTAYGAAVALVLLLLGLPPAGSLLLGAGLAGVGATSVGTGAVAAQLFDVRRRAVGAGSLLLGLAFVLRMLGNRDDGSAWLLHLTPFGWLDRLEPFATDRWPRLLPLLLVPAVLVALAVAERGRRDDGAARLAGRDRRRPRLTLLSSQLGFAWRLGAGVLTAWVVGCALLGLVMGSLVGAVVDLLDTDDDYRRTLERLGVDLSSPVEGFVSLLATSLALAFALQAVWRVGALRAEEGSGRLDHLLVRPLHRSTWLATGAGLTVLGGTLTALAAGVGVWVGSALTSAGLSAGQAIWPLLATVPVVVVFAGLAVLVLGAAPRLTVGVPLGLAVAAYLLDLVGPLLDLPGAVLGLSPFHWLPRPPDDAFAPASAGSLVLIGVAGSAVGAVLLSRRDVTPD